MRFPVIIFMPSTPGDTESGRSLPGGVGPHRRRGSRVGSTFPLLPTNGHIEPFTRVRYKAVSASPFATTCATLPLVPDDGRGVCTSFVSTHGPQVRFGYCYEDTPRFATWLRGPASRRRTISTAEPASTVSPSRT